MLNWNEIIWQQFGAAIDTFENAIKACPEEIWSSHERQPEVWYSAFHTLFFLDFYLDDSPDDFHPPPPFTLSELDPSGKMPERVFTKDEILTYLEHCRKKCIAKLESMTEEKFSEKFKAEWKNLSTAELLLYNMRHVQHHAAQLNLILRQETNTASKWVSRAKEPLTAIGNNVVIDK